MGEELISSFAISGRGLSTKAGRCAYRNIGRAFCVALALIFPAGTADAGLFGNKMSLEERATSAGGIHRTVTVDGVDREYVVFGADRAADPAPVVFVFHGGGGSALRIAGRTEFHKRAQRDGAITVYPDKSGSRWNDGRETTADTGDDLAFVEAMISDLHQRHGVDRQRLYAMGVSNGGIFMQRLGCARGGMFRALSSIAANMAGPLASDCAPARPVSFLMINGTADSAVPWRAGELGRPLGIFGAGGHVRSTPDTIRHWQRNADCAPRPDKMILPDRAPQDGTRVVRYRWRGCAAGVEVLLYKIKGGAHGIPGLGSAGWRNPGQDMNAISVIHEFFSRHGL